MIMWPCQHCKLKGGCVKRADILAKVRGLYMTTASIRCRDSYALFPPGTRVTAVFRVDELVGHDLDGAPNLVESTHEISGTVMYRHGRRIRVWLDEGLGDPKARENKEGRFIIALYPDRLTKIGGFVPVCTSCGRPRDQNNSPAWFCGEIDGPQACRFPPESDREQAKEQSCPAKGG